MNDVKLVQIYTLKYFSQLSEMILSNPEAFFHRVSKNEYFVLFHVRTVIGKANEFERMDGRTDLAIRSSWRQTFFLLSTYIDLVLFLVGKWKL